MINTEGSLLFAQFELVPLNISVGNEKFFSCSLHVVVGMVGGFEDRVKEMEHFVFHEIVNHDSLTEDSMPSGHVFVFVRHAFPPGVDLGVDRLYDFG